MSEKATTSIETMKYNELKALAAEQGLDASGTKEDLIARLKDAGVGSNASTASSEESEGNKGGNAEIPHETPQSEARQSTIISAAQEQVEEKKADRALRESARQMKEHLEKQPKVSIMIPFEAGENPENGKKVPFHVNLNGYAMNIPRGVYVQVPQQVADVIKERLESEGKIGSQWRIDRDQNKLNALS